MRSSIFFIFISVLALRMLSLVPVVIDVDEAWFAASAATLVSPFDFFRHALDNKPPGTVWFFWCVQKLAGLGAEPRAARAVSILVSLVTAGLVSLFLKPPRRLLAAFAFLTASVIASPKLLATTTEALLLPLVCFSMWLSWRSFEEQGEKKTNAMRFVVVGISLGVALVLKQTAVVFLLPALYAAVHSRRALVALCLGMLFPVLLVMQALGWNTYWYWTVSYPGVVLTTIRSHLFAQNQQFLINAVLFVAALWPLLLSCTVQVWRAFSQVQQRFLGLWIISALLAVVIGQGLFLHYFILLVPPLCILFANVRLQRTARIGLGWLYASYAVACFIAAIPALGVFWGVDLAYYERLGDTVKRVSGANDRIFIWGGNALSLVTSERRHATRFVTARFAAPPYATPQTEIMFEKDFRRDLPKVFVDLHHRGDGRFKTPVSAVPWLSKELEQNYTVVLEPTLPWAVIYRRHERGARGLASVNTRAVRLDFDSLYKTVNVLLDDPFQPTKTFRFVQRCFCHPSHAMALESLLRAWEGLRMHSLSSHTPNDESIQGTYRQLRRAILRQAEALTSEEPTQYDDDQELARRTLVWLERQFRWNESPMPLPVQSRAWWVSVALVTFQPR